MRLIDADELIKRIGKWIPKDSCGKEQTVEEIVATDIAVSVCMEIEEAPTKFDKEKVKHELEKSSKLYSLSEKDCEFAIPQNIALEIVEKGGIG